MQHSSGLMSASSLKVKTGYDKAWIRDNIYESLALEHSQNNEDKLKLIKAYRALLDIFLKHENKIDWMIKQPFPKEKHRYIHARFNPSTLEEFWEDWGNKQNDAVGAFLFKIADLEEKGLGIIKNENDKRIIQKLVWYLEAIEYWHDKDNGMWEENEEVHASSVGACVAGLIKIKKNKLANVNPDLISLGIKTLKELLPRESETKEVDLALLSLIYPYEIVTEEQRNAILKNVEEKLLKQKGVLRYIGDQYYNHELGEPEWTMGLPWLAIIYKKLGNENKYLKFMKMTYAAFNDNDELPELYFRNTDKHNENTPLGWSQSLFVVAERIKS
ncbi:MAG: glycoside hydrolase family 15 protein [Nanoarchaeota archaeon]|nr:glycoside hydrolase family 15 protein [Nanoarchaeota archaeon]